MIQVVVFHAEILCACRCLGGLKNSTKKKSNLVAKEKLDNAIL